MAEIIRPTNVTIQPQGQINQSTAGEFAVAGEALGNPSIQQGQQMQQSKFGAMTNELGDYIAGESVRQLKEQDSAIRSSVYADKFTRATSEFLQGAANRAKQVTDADGNPLFGSLVSDVGKMGTQTLQKYLQGITDPVIIQQLTANFNSQVNTSQLQAMQTAFTQQKEFSIASYQSMKDLTLKQANLDTASNIPVYIGRLQEVLQQKVAAGEISPEFAQKELQDNDRFLRVSHVEKDIEANPYAALTTLAADKGELGLNDSDVLALKKQAQTAVTHANAVKKAQGEALKTKYKDFLDQTKSMSLKGQAIPIKMQEFGDAIFNGTEAQDDWSKTKATNDIAQRFTQYSLEEQKELRAAMAASGTTDPDNFAALAVVDQIISNTEKRLESDPVGLAVEQKFAANLPPLDFNQPLGEQLSARAANMEVANKHYGTKVVLSEQDSAALSKRFANSSPEEQIALNAEVTSSLGEEVARTLWKDVSQTPEGKNIAFNAHIQMNYGSQAAYLDKQGQMIRSNKDIILPKDEDIESIMPAIPGNQNIEYAMQQQNSIKNLGMAYAKAAGVTGTDASAYAPYFQKAADVIAPSTIINGVAVPVPVGMTADELQRQHVTIQDSDVLAQGQALPPAGYPDATQAQIVKSSKYVPASATSGYLEFEGVRIRGINGKDYVWTPGDVIQARTTQTLNKVEKDTFDKVTSFLGFDYKKSLSNANKLKDRDADQARKAKIRDDAIVEMKKKLYTDKDGK